MKLLKFAVVGLTLPLLAACAAMGPDVESTKAMAVKGDAFAKALHAEYVALAMSEREQGDTDSAEYYNKKAMDVAAGKNVMPQALKERKLPKGTEDEIEAARAGLVTALVTGGKQKAPAASAKAQAMLDCWLEQQEENDQPKDIEACRSAFNKAFGELDKAMQVVAVAKPAAPAPAAKPAPKSFIVYFDFNSSKLDAKAMAVIKEAAAAKGKQVVVTGHTDTSGSAKFNNMLSEKRAAAVSAALAKAGVNKNTIVMQGFGEDELAKKTGDKVKEAMNRRVTIVIP